MPTETELRTMLRTTPVSNGLNVQDIIRKSKARRLPRQIGASGAFGLAIAGIGIAGFTGINRTQPAADSIAGVAEPGMSSESVPFTDQGQSLKRAPADKINLCGGPLAEAAPSQFGLELTVDAVEATAGSPYVDATVTLTNTSDTQVTGTTGASPALTLSKDGVVLWHSNGPVAYMITMIDLAPGESQQMQASFVPVTCGVEDDMQESFREGLPALPAGDYDISAALDFVPDVVGPNAPPEGSIDLVTGPLSPVTLR